MRSVTRFATLLFATAALAACDDKVPFSNVVTPIGPTTSIAGTWHLQTLNGQGLPQTITVGGIPVLLSESILTLVATNSAAGTFSLAVTTDDGSGPVTNTVTGDYGLVGTALTFVAGGVTVTGTWDGANMLTLSEFGATAVYTRP